MNNMFDDDSDKDRRRNFKMTRKNRKHWNNPRCIADRKLGDNTEKYFTPILNAWFNTTFNIDYTGWRVFDLIDPVNKIAVELKTRRCRSDKYHHTMIGKSKWDESRRLGIKGYKSYLFIKFKNKTVFLQFPVMLGEGMFFKEGGCFHRGREEIKEHLYIPMEYFEDLRDYPNITDYLEK